MNQINNSQKLLNRKTLKELFEDGMRPSGASFSNLIYSMVNKLDDGIEKNFDHGLSLSPQGNNAESLLSLFHQVDDAHSAWTIGLTRKEEGGALNFKEGKTNKSRLYLKQNGAIGINTTHPKHLLDINGTLGVKIRKGTFAQGEVLANGKWQTILKNQTDCQLFELTASARGNKGEGKYAVLYAVALNPYAGKKGMIKKYQSYYGWKWWRRLKVRWIGTPFNYQLQIRTVSNYGEDGAIQFNITKLI
jgi:hypothetical protein